MGKILEINRASYEPPGRPRNHATYIVAIFGHLPENCSEKGI
jgi:hypothetical protein